MYLRVIGDCFSENIFKEIEAFTNYGILYFKKVRHDEEKKIIFIPVERCQIKAVKKMFLGATTSYKYDKNVTIPSWIAIRNITECQVENNFDDPSISKIRLLFGMHVKPKEKEIYIGSVEEDRGKTCYRMKLKVSEVDIEIGDQNETTPWNGVRQR